MASPPPETGCPTVIVTVLLAVPPLPVQLKLYEVETVKGPTPALPVTGRELAQAPDAVHEVAFVAVQDKVEEPLTLTNAGLAANVITGAELVGGGDVGGGDVGGVGNESPVNDVLFVEVTPPPLQPTIAAKTTSGSNCRKVWPGKSGRLD